MSSAQPLPLLRLGSELMRENIHRSERAARLSLLDRLDVQAFESALLQINRLHAGMTRLSKRLFHGRAETSFFQQEVNRLDIIDPKVLAKFAHHHVNTIHGRVRWVRKPW